ncbi:hypothetical protein [Enterococcus sp. ZJ1668]|uniref:hypothetical protein n=1 Tax=Enterococcus sp. ZJ1668 TaxID=2709402 RepID=UPI0013EBCB69|nr:hypothetical protein [Enterococcus sp. ZJ1668]
MKKRQIKKNNKKITNKLAKFVAISSDLEKLGVYSINIDRRGIKCQMLIEKLISLPFVKVSDINFKAFECSEEYVEATVCLDGIEFCSLVDREELSRYFPRETEYFKDVEAYE